MNMINLIIPAAGEATRLRPLSSYTSKAMVRVNGKPCIDYILEQAHKITDINEIVIVDGKYDDIREYCSIRYPYVKFAKQKILNGPHDAIRIGIESLRDKSLPLVVWLGDAIILDDDMPFGTDFLLCKEVKDHHNWCMWDAHTFYNKPEHMIPHAVALVGLYSFANGNNVAAAFYESQNSYDISDALDEYIRINGSLFNRVITNKWYDIGDLPTYYKTCAQLLTLKARAFHNIHYDANLGVICKKPDNDSLDTIRNERAWYSSLTPEQSMFVPRILPHETDLILSYESGTLLSDLMLYEQLRESTWEYIIDKVFRIKLKYFNQSPTNKEFIQDFSDLANDMWITKTIDRLKKTNLLNDQQVKALIENAHGIVKIAKPIEGMHGDLHFGNILYNQQTDQIKFIDPRGKYGFSTSGSYGDNIYDFAKLAHDLYHGYNAMVANESHNELVSQIFIKMLQKYSLPEKEIIDGGLLLIATCIPLHYEDPARQIRFANYVASQL